MAVRLCGSMNVRLCGSKYFQDIQWPCNIISVELEIHYISATIKFGAVEVHLSSDTVIFGVWWKSSTQLQPEFNEVEF